MLSLSLRTNVIVMMLCTSSTKGISLVQGSQWNMRQVHQKKISHPVKEIVMIVVVVVDVMMVAVIAVVVAVEVIEINHVMLDKDHTIQNGDS